MKRILTLLISFFISLSTYAQKPPPSSFGGFYSSTFGIKDEVSPQQRNLIQEEVRKNIRELDRKGVLPKTNKTGAIPKFIFPLRQAAGFNEHGFYGISNYVDLDSSAGIKDFNCGSRTYEGHMGTDFFIDPFPWHKMDEGAVEIVAAAPGTIVARAETRPDTSCANCPVDAPPDCWYWNAVYLQHDDGTLTMYGHMKQYSLTTKLVGETVTAGEFLGIVGSSGNSTGPHLHFEVWQDTFFNKLIDPWAGSCNYTTGESYWANQEPYYVSHINDIITGTNIPVPYSCYLGGNGEKTFAKDTFNLGETVYFTSFVRDNRPDGNPYHLKLIDPDDVVIFDWYLDPFSVFYPSAYFYYYFNSSVINKGGEWKFYLQYDEDEFTKSFFVQDVMPLTLVDFTARPAGNKIELEWKTMDEVNTDYFSVERSLDGSVYGDIGTISARGTTKSGSITEYEFFDGQAPASELFYRLKMVDLDKKFTYSAIQRASLKDIAAVVLFPNPAKNKITLQHIERFTKVRITDLRGRTVLLKPISAGKVELDITSLPEGIYILQLGKETFEVNLKLIKN